MYKEVFRGAFLLPVPVSHCRCVFIFLADWHSGAGRWGMLVPEGYWQDPRWQTRRTARFTSQIPETWSAQGQGQFQSHPLCWKGGLQRFPVAAEEHGSPKREHRYSTPGLVQRVHPKHLERWSVVHFKMIDF